MEIKIPLKKKRFEKNITMGGLRKHKCLLDIFQWSLMMQQQFILVAAIQMVDPTFQHFSIVRTSMAAVATSSFLFKSIKGLWVVGAVV